MKIIFEGTEESVITEMTEFLQRRISKNEIIPLNRHGLEIDGAGFPWNPEIHSPRKSKTSNDLWTKKRGADKNRITAIEMECSEQDLAADPAGTAIEVEIEDPLNPSKSEPPVIDVVASCLERSHAAMNHSEDSAIKTAVSKSINAILATVGIVGQDASSQLMKDPAKAKQILPTLQALCNELDV